jgi:pimeloyl-ACP methyl ester carboxylesterase
MGRFHPQLVRFANALAASGAAVLIPEVPEWRDLRLAPAATVPTVRAAVDALRMRPEVLPGPFGLMGFSFGAPQAVIAATHATLVTDIAGVVVFGGYCDLERTLRCQLTGCHDWDGVDHVLSPDPYGRWCVASNYLTSVAGFEDAGDVAGALRCLAIASTEQRLAAWLPEHDALKAELRSSLPQRRQALFDLFAPPTGEIRGELHERVQMAVALAGACRRVEPLLDPAGRLAEASTPVRLIHGRGDRLVPFTESLRFHDRLPSTVEAHVTVTGLFAHSADVSPPSLGARIWEGAVFFEALRGLINTV